MIATYTFYFAQGWWLVMLAIAVPPIWYMALRNLKSISVTRRVLAAFFRTLAMAILVGMLARPMFGEKSDLVTVLAVVDRSQSVSTVIVDRTKAPPVTLLDSGIAYLNTAMVQKNHPATDKLAVVDVAETASIATLPSNAMTVPQRCTNLAGEQSYLESGVQMAMAIAPPDTAARILLVSDGNETSGDLRQVARLAAANHIPIDVLPLRFKHLHDVVFSRLAAPLKAHSGQTITLRLVLNSTSDNVGGLLHLTLNGKALAIDPPNVDAHVVLHAGVNVKTVSLPVGSRGIQEYEATYIPDDPRQDEISQNDRASAMTYVTGPGHVLLVEADEAAGNLIASARSRRGSTCGGSRRPSSPRLSELMDTDCMVLADTENGNFSLQQQEMMCRYVTDMGGGLVMTGGPHSFGAGGWIGSPVASVLPVDLDPPQKQQMPKGVWS